MPETVTPTCNHCETQLVERKTKNNRTIYACPNWRFDGKGCQGTIYDPHQEDERKKIYPRVVIRWNVQSRSEPGKFRTVEIYEDGHMRDNCMAGEMQRFCHHQKVVGKKLKDLVKLIEQVNNVDFDKVLDNNKIKDKNHEAIK